VAHVFLHLVQEGGGVTVRRFGFLFVWGGVGGECSSIDANNLISHTPQNQHTQQIDRITKKDEKRTRPQAMNTVEMLKEASKQLGMGPHQAMSVAERLYLNGCVCGWAL
jgi:DNA topoisomerase IA